MPDACIIKLCIFCLHTLNVLLTLVLQITRDSEVKLWKDGAIVDEAEQT